MGNHNNSSKPFKKEDVIIYQQKNHICKIYIYLNNLLSGISNGFFCLIPYPDENHLIHALITTYRTINEKFINENKEIKLTLNNDSQKRTIKIDDKRKIYMNEDYDTTIIEIKPEKDKINYFLELDSYLFKENSGEIYNKSKIYLICYGKENKTESYDGDIKDIKSLVNSNVIYNIDTNEMVYKNDSSKVINQSNVKYISNMIYVYKLIGLPLFAFALAAFVMEYIMNFIRKANKIETRFSLSLIQLGLLLTVYANLLVIAVVYVESKSVAYIMKYSAGTIPVMQIFICIAITGLVFNIKEIINVVNKDEEEPEDKEDEEEEDEIIFIN